MKGIGTVVPNNEELDAETRARTYPHGAASSLGYDTATSDIIACVKYPMEIGDATELYPTRSPAKVSGEVGRPSPLKTIGDDVIVLSGASGARLEIGVADTYATRDWLLPAVPRAEASEDTIPPLMTVYDIFGAVFGRPNITILPTQVPKPSFERFIERTNKLGHRSEPVIKGKGIPVWAIAAYVLDLGLPFEEVVVDWGGEISVDEVKAAMEYYQAYPEEIEQKRKWTPPR